MVIGGIKVSDNAIKNMTKDDSYNTDIKDNQDNNIKHDSGNFYDFKELNPEQEEIADWLGNLRFRKQLVGGISEYDVWKKIIELNAMYEEALKAEHIRCDAIIDHQKKQKILRR